MITEATLEQLCLSWFTKLGWEVFHGPDIAPDSDSPLRESYVEAILPSTLKQSLRDLNPNLPPSALDEAYQKLRLPDNPVLVKANQQLHEYLIYGVPVEYETTERTVGQRVKVIDYENPNHNRFFAINQFTVKGTKMNRRPDIVCFVNGLPLVVIELKNPADKEADIWKAYQQLQTYKDEAPDLFYHNLALIISDGSARLGSLTVNEERFTPWRTIDHEKDFHPELFELEVMIRGFMRKDFLLFYQRYCVVFEEKKSAPIKKIAAYHQFHAVRSASEAIYEATQVTRDGRCGVVWHTQGSGKSISMSLLAGRVVADPRMKNPTIIIVTDRNDLDGQLFETFCNAKSLLQQSPEQAESRDEVRTLLSNRAAGGIIFTTIQKFALMDGEKAFPVLSDRSNILVMSDEAHRSQYGTQAKFNEKSGKYTYGYAKYLRDAFPNAGFIGFTGTPIESQDKSTRAVFGDEVSVYDIEQAVEDGATVRIYYESRMVKLGLNTTEMAGIDTKVDCLMEEYAEYGIDQEKSKWAALEALVGEEGRRVQVAKDLVEHFESRQETFDGKSLMVCMSRNLCVKMYDEIVKLRPTWHDDDPMKGAIKVIMTGSASDKPNLQKHIHAKSVKKELEKRIKDPSDPLKIVIVRDMWLTGFDVPCLNTLYVDKPMKGHNLMQAIARVNRVFGDKPGGLVVDYIGIAEELREATRTYTANKGKGKPTIDATEVFSIMLEKIEVLRGILHGFNYKAFKNKALELLPGAMNHVLGIKDGKKRFCDACLSMSKAYALCKGLAETRDYAEEIAFLQTIKAFLIKTDSKPTGKRDFDIEAQMRQIMSRAIVAEGVVDVFEAAGLDKPDLSILSDEFLQRFMDSKHENLAVELLQKLINDEISSRLKNNIVKQKKFSELLKASVAKYQNRSIHTAQVIEELIQMAKDLREAGDHGKDFGLNDDDMAFYDALADNEAAVRELGDDILKKIATEVTQKLRTSITVDWAVRESVRARLRLLVKRVLRKWKYPPDKSEEAIDLVLSQAEVLSEAWL